MRALVIGLTLIILCNIGYATTLHVPDEYAIIQDAINASSNSDTVLVAPGEYAQHINFIGKNIVVRGSGADVTILLQPSGENEFVVFANEEDTLAQLDGFTLEGGTEIQQIHVINGARPRITNCVFHGFRSGKDASAVIRVESDAIIRNNLFYDNGGTGCISIFNQGTASIINNTFDQNDRGFHTVNGRGIAYNNIITHSLDYGVYGSYTEFDYNDIWNNGVNYYETEPGEHDISIDPIYADPNNADYTLRIESPCIDAGNPDMIFNDEDGSRNDMGAFPYLNITYPIAANINLGTGTVYNISTTLSPEFFWSYIDDDETTQTQCEVEVGTDSDWSIAEMWASGPIASTDPSIAYNGSPLADNSHYYVRIRLHNGENWGNWCLMNFFTHISTVLHVPGDLPSIPAAINIAFVGDTVLVAPGDYYEHVDFSGKSIVVKGEETANTILHEPPDGGSFVTFASEEDTLAHLCNFTLNGGTGNQQIDISNGARPKITDCVFRNFGSDKDNAAVIRVGHDAIIRNNLFYDNFGTGCISIYEGTASIINNTFDNNLRGFHTVTGQGVARNNIVTNSQVYGIYGNFTELDYNDVWNNDVDYYQSVPGEHDISIDPLYSDPPSYDYTLSDQSPCIDAGDPDQLYYDADGTRNDMGAYPHLADDYPYAGWINFGNGPNVNILHTLSPDFYWSFMDDAETTQSRFEIEIGTDNDWTEAEMWSPGPVVSSDTSVSYFGIPLDNKTSYFVRIRVHNGIKWGGWREKAFYISIPGILHVPNDYASIQAAMDASSTFDTILVAPGAYTEHIDFMGKGVIVRAADPAATFLYRAEGYNECVMFENEEDTLAQLDGFIFEGGTGNQQIMVQGGAKPRITNCTFRDFSPSKDNSAVIRVGFDAIIRHNVFYNNGGTSCISIFSGTASIINNTFDKNNRGFHSTTGRGIVKNNIVSNSKEYGVYGSFTEFDYNDIWNNNPNYASASPGDNDISLDPQFADAVSGDYRLSLTSPCIDAGDPAAQYNDPDGSRNDMGAYAIDVNSYPLAFHIHFGGGYGQHTVTTLTPEFYWTFVDYLPTTQYQFEVEVGTDQDWSTAEMWATGFVVSSNSHILYDGLPLEDLTIYYLRIRVHNGDKWGEWQSTSFLVRIPAVINVPGDFASIQEAIEFASAGDIIEVAPGTYAEHIDFIGKSVTVQGAGADLSILHQPSGVSEFVRFNSAEDRMAILDGFTLEGGTGNELIVIANNANPTISHCVFRDFGWLKDNSAAIRIGSNAMIRNNLFYNNGGTGCISIYGGTGTILNNTFDSNRRGFHTVTGQGIAINNIVTNSVDYGVYGSFTELDYNDVWNNGADFIDANPGIHNISGDPLYENASSGNFNLTIYSPCLDSGDPNPVYNDLDGTRSDMGAFPLIIDDFPIAAYINFGPDSDQNAVLTYHPQFFWKYFDIDPTSQTQYELEVGTDDEWSMAEMWTTGPVASTDTTVLYAGQPLINRQTYYVRVRVNNGTDWGGWRTAVFFVRVPATIEVPGDYATIQSGINAAFTGDTVLVYPGTYQENIILGSEPIFLTSVAGRDETIIQSAALGTPVLEITTPLDTTMVISGFTFMGSEDMPGILCSSASPIIEYCTIRDCINSGYGVGVFCRASSAIIRYNKIFDNTNTAPDRVGGGIAIFDNDGGTLSIIGNEIYDNSQPAGAAIGCNDNARVLIEDNLIYGNTCVGTMAGSIFLATNTRATIINNTITGNSNGLYASSSRYVWVYNNIITDNDGFGFKPPTNEDWYDYNNVWRNGSYNQTNINGISEDPKFINAEAHIYYLLPESPCIDAGNPDPVYDDPDGSRNDLGAFTFTNEPFPVAISVNFGNDSYGNLVGTYTPEFFWTYRDINPTVQTRYEIQVGIDDDWESAELWSSGAIGGADTQAVYAGNILENRHTYFYRIRVSSGDTWGWWTGGSFTIAFGTTIHVPDDFASIQQAINNSDDFDTILVAPGTYVENLDFSGKRVTVLGAGAAFNTLKCANVDIPTVYFGSAEDTLAHISGFAFNGGGNREYIFTGFGSNPKITDCVFSYFEVPDGSNAAIYINSKAIIRHNTFYNNNGFACILLAQNSNATITNNTFNANSRGIVNLSSGGIVMNNILAHTIDRGITGIFAVLDYNDMWNNGQDYQYADPGPHDLSADPLFLNLNGYDFRLHPQSPCIDAGNPEPLYDDPDGTRNDIGAFPLNAAAYPLAEQLQFGPHAAGNVVLTDIPEFSWQYIDLSEGQQERYEIEVGTDPNWDIAEMWQSGPVMTSDNAAVYAGIPLTFGANYYLRIRVHNGDHWGSWAETPFRVHQSVAISVPGDVESIQAAIDMASTGDSIIVQPGDYAENLSIIDKNIVLKSAEGAESTIITSNKSNEAIVTFLGAVDTNTVFSGFTVQGSSGYCGIYCYRSSPIIENCEVIECSSDQDGTGIYCIYSGAKLRHNRLHDNVNQNLYNTGGAIGFKYGAPSVLEISDNIIYDNIEPNGTGIGCPYGYNAQISRNQIYHNLGSGEYAGGIYINGFDCDIINNTIVNNTRGMIIPDGQNVHIYNNIVVSNIYQGLVPGGAITDYNDIWDNGTFNSGGPNGISADPKFMALVPDRLFALTPSSPCINAGHPDPMYNDPDGSRNDMGALPISPDAFPIAGNVNFGSTGNDGFVFTENPEFYWTFVDFSSNSQTYYEIQVGTDQDWTGAEMWDSGPVASADTQAVYAGEQLYEFTSYYFRIRVNNGTRWGQWVDGEFRLRISANAYVPDGIPTIQQAIELVNSFDTVFVSAGVYHENLNFLGKSIVLMGEGAEVTTLIPANEFQTVVEFNNGESDMTHMSGFTLSGGSGNQVILIDQGAQPRISYCVFKDYIWDKDNTAVIRVKSDAHIDHNLFYNNGGVSCISITDGGTATVINNTFDANNRAIHTVTERGILYNNIITNSVGYGVYGQFEENDYNDVWNNHPNYDNSYVGANSISVNPVYVNQSSGNYRLGLESPCIDAGNPDGSYNDVDGTRNDMGAFAVNVNDFPIAININFGASGYGDTVLVQTPEIYWTYYGRTTGEQYQYEIECGTDNNWSSAELWSSGPIISSDTSTIYAGLPFPGNQILYLRIRVHDGNKWGAWQSKTFLTHIDRVIHVPEQYSSITDAIGVAWTLDTILVGPGTYQENISFVGKKLVITSTDGPESTIIESASDGAAVVTFNSTEDTLSVLDGFGVRGAVNAHGILCVGSAPIIQNCEIYDCENSNDGVGIYCLNSGAKIRYNRIHDNLNSNSAKTGCGIGFKGSQGERLVIAYNEIYDNVSGHGTAIGCPNGGNAYITRNIIYNNTGDASTLAGGIYFGGSNCRIENNTIAGNTHGIRIIGGSSSTIYNNIVVDNEGKGVEPGSASCDYNDVWANGENNLPGPNGISEDPEFLNESAHDFRLMPGSPCIDSGHPGTAYDDEDGTRNDMGALPLSPELFPVAENITFGPYAIGNIVQAPLVEFHWAYVDLDQLPQQQYEIEIGTDRDWTVAEVWTSGQVVSAAGQVSYAGAPLNDRIRYYLRLRLNNGTKWGVWVESEFMLASPDVLAVPDEYATIQSAIDAARIYDSVVVAPGIYTENVNYGGKSVFVVGSPIGDVFLKPENPDYPVVHFETAEDSITTLSGFILKECAGLALISIENGAKPRIENCEFTESIVDDGDVINIQSGGTIQDNVFYKNTSVYSCVFLSNTSNAVILNNTFDDNYRAIASTASRSRVYNNNITGNISGIYGYAMDMDYNNVWGNTSNYSNAVKGAHDISLDPLYQSPDIGIYYLRSGSPCIDAGYPGAQYNDIDGTPNDIGAFSYIFEYPMPAAVSLGDENLDHVINHHPVIYWSYVDTLNPQTAFEIQVGDDNDWSEAEMWAPGIISSTDTAVVYDGLSLFDHNTYYVRLRVYNGSSWSHYQYLTFAMNTMPSLPSLFRPAPHARVKIPVIELEVLNSDDLDGDALSYDYEVYAGPDLVELIAYQYGVPENAEYITVCPYLDALVEGGDYYWRARAYDGFEYSAWTDARELIALTPSVYAVPDDAGTIQGAIDLAESGDSVVVSAGEYWENISFDGKRIVVTGAGADSTVLHPEITVAPAVSIRQQERFPAEFSGFTVDGGDGECQMLIMDMATPVIKSCIFRDFAAPNNYNAVIQVKSDATILRNLFIRNGATGCISIDMALDVRIVNNTFVNNTIAMYTKTTGYSHGTALNNIIVHCSQTGIVGSFGGSDYNCLYNNVVDYTGQDYEGGENDISGDPRFVNTVVDDYRLLLDSPCIDAGHPGEEYNDPDGSRNDIGALPFEPPNQLLMEPDTVRMFYLYSNDPFTIDFIVGNFYGDHTLDDIDFESVRINGTLLPDDISLDTKHDEFVGYVMKASISGAAFLAPLGDIWGINDMTYSVSGSFADGGTFQFQGAYTLIGHQAGDANYDEVVNIGDAVHIVNYIFKGGPAPVVPDMGDANADGRVNIGDAVRIVDYLFRDGAVPVHVQ